MQYDIPMLEPLPQQPLWMRGLRMAWRTLGVILLTLLLIIRRPVCFVAAVAGAGATLAFCVFMYQHHYIDALRAGMLLTGCIIVHMGITALTVRRID